MPVILTRADEVATWMTATPDEALKLQRRFRTDHSGPSPAASRKTWAAAMDLKPKTDEIR